MSSTNKQVVRTNMELQGLANLLAQRGQSKVSIVAWAVVRNRRRVEQILGDIEAAAPMTPAAIAYSKARAQLLERHARRDEQGNAVTMPHPADPKLTVFLLSDSEAFAVDEQTLRQAHREGAAEAEACEQRRQELLALPAEFEPYVLSVKDVPDGTFDADTMDLLEVWGILVD